MKFAQHFHVDEGMDVKMLRRFLMGVTLACMLGACSSTRTGSVAVDESKPELSPAKEEAWRLLTGKWYGDQPTKEGGRSQWIVHRARNGTYQIDFLRTSANGNVEKNTELGQWGMSGEFLFNSFRGWMDGATFRPADTSDPYNYDAYRIIRLDREILEYQHVDTGNRFTVRRVPDNFEFPK